MNTMQTCAFFLIFAAHWGWDCPGFTHLWAKQLRKSPWAWNYWPVRNLRQQKRLNCLGKYLVTDRTALRNFSCKLEPSSISCTLHAHHISARTKNFHLITYWVMPALEESIPEVHTRKQPKDNGLTETKINHTAEVIGCAERVLLKACKASHGWDAYMFKESRGMIPMKAEVSQHAGIQLLQKFMIQPLLFRLILTWTRDKHAGILTTVISWGFITL